MAAAGENGVVTMSQHGVDVVSLKAGLTSVHPRERLEHLQSVKGSTANEVISSEDQTVLLNLLYSIYPLHQDRASRKAVQSCLPGLLISEKSRQSFLRFLQQETKKQGLAPSNAFVLVEWCSTSLQGITELSEWTPWGLPLLSCLARALERCSGGYQRPSVQRSAIVIVRRALRHLFIRQSALQKHAIESAVAQLCKPSGDADAKNAILLGVMAGVCARDARAKAVFESKKDLIYQFYTKELLAARAPIPDHLATGLHGFFANFLTLADLETDIVPVVEKALLRAPEIVLRGILVRLFEAAPENMDLSKPLQQNLLKPILSNLKSTNGAVLTDIQDLLRIMLPRCADAQAMVDIVETVLGPLKAGKLPSADTRAQHSIILSFVPISPLIAPLLQTGSLPVIAKETNEQSLEAQVSTLLKACLWSCQNGEVLTQAVLDAFSKGLADKKPAIRRIWATRIGDMLADRNDWSSVKSKHEMFKAIVTPLLVSWREVLVNPLAAAQSGLLVNAYVLTGLVPLIEKNADASVNSELSKASIIPTTLLMEPKPSFLLNPRIYGKLSGYEEQFWFFKALFAQTDAVIQLPNTSASSLAWSQAIIFSICSSTSHHKTQGIASRALTDLALQHETAIFDAMLGGLKAWQNAVELEDKDTAVNFARTGSDKLHAVIASLCVGPKSPSSERKCFSVPYLENALVSLVVLGQRVLVPNNDWIDLCLKAGIDPGKLALSRQDALFERILEASDFNEGKGPSPLVLEAACNAVAQIAFVAPSTLPRLIDTVRSDLASDSFANIGPTELAIFRTPEGTLCIDVLASKPQPMATNKNMKDYDIIKWEEDLKQQLAQKKGQRTKLTAEESSKIKAQIEKESAIRMRLRNIEARLLRGIGIIRSLITGPPTDIMLWLGPAVQCLLDTMSQGTGVIAGSLAPDVYLLCANALSQRLGPLASSVGLATLRSMQVPYLPESMLHEPLPALVTRVLFRLRFAAEQRQFDKVHLMYILPLPLRVLQDGGSGSAEDVDTQIVLAIEFLSIQTGCFTDERLPRAQILQTLIESMQKYNQHWKAIKDCFADACRCIAPNISIDEISVLVKGAIVPQTSIRTAVLQSISADVDLSELDFCDEIWLAAHDDAMENRELGHEIMDENKFEVKDGLQKSIQPYLSSQEISLRQAAARALAEIVQIRPACFHSVLEDLQDLYIDLAKPKVQKLDAYGLPVKTDLSDAWQGRHGIALAFQHLAPTFEGDMLNSFLQFLIEHGPLGDRDATVRAAMAGAAREVIVARGKQYVEVLMQTLEATLAKDNDGSEFADRVNEAVIVLYGAVASHLRAGEPRVPKVVDRLIATLSTPSEAVQYAVATCLPPLVRASREKAPEYVSQLLEMLLQSKKYAARRGAAYGLAGIVGGLGIAALREHRIMQSLSGAVDSRKDANAREGALLAYELLAMILGRVLEPYIIQIVPHLLSSFGDSNADVRDACLAAAKACFASLSSFGVKEILPTLLAGLDDDQWRSKKGACDLLGAMAYLEPQELAHSLPQIIPPLSAVLNDSHKEVRLASNRSLKRFGEVISNPEIKSLIDILLKALSDPTKYTDDALDALIKVSFVHYLDSPSLALVVRILQRGLGDRSATKRKSAQVIGSLAHLTERRDLTAHLPVLVGGLRVAVVDPVPTTRATAAKALGALVEKLSEDALPDLIPDLMQTLKSDTGAGDRLGSAQALSEVLAGLGTTRLDETLPTILQNVVSVKPAVREGFMSLFIFLPVCFGNSFAAYLSRIIPPILSGLSDEVESIRETALRAGRLLVKNFASKAVDLLLPELERGLADDSYRIRLSSVELVGDLLFNLTGISANAEQDDAEDRALEAGASLVEALGMDKRNKILSSLYMCRSDTSGLVRSAAINVWKALVSSPRTLKELIPNLTQLIIQRLGSSNMEQKVIAGNALGELIRKAGDTVLSTLLPTLEEGLQKSTDVDSKQGICIALKELITSASEEALADHEDVLISVVRTGLVDVNADVREAAAEAFDALQAIFGKRAVDQVLPHLLSLLRQKDEADNALSALLTLLTETTRSNIILPNLIPTLTSSPITAFNAKALASLANVAGSAMTRRLPAILNALMDNIVKSKDMELRTELQSAFDSVLSSIDPFDGLNTAMSVMLALAKHDDHHRRANGAYHLGRFFASTTVDYSRYYPDLIRALLISFDDRDAEVVKAAWQALTELTKHLKKEEMESLVTSTRQSLLHIGVAGSDLPGFGLPKGINAILPIFLQGLMNGTSEQKVQSALAISDICDRTNGESLKPFVTQITGPLIRVVSERSTEVKAAVLFTLNQLLQKIPTYLKPFLPQLQRTFAKSLADPSSEVLRARAAKALGALIQLTPRIDPLVNELLAGVKASDTGVRNAMLKALYEVISKAGANLGEAPRAAILSLIDTDTESHDISTAITNAKLLGALVKNLPSDMASSLIKHRIMTSSVSQASVLALNAVLLECPTTLTESEFAKELPGMLCRGMTHNDPFISDNYVLATGKFLLLDSRGSEYEVLRPIFETLASIIPPSRPVDTRRLALVVVRTTCRHHSDIVRPHLVPLAGSIFASVRDPVIPVKLAAEAAFLALFNVVEDEGAVFDRYIASQEMPANQKRSMQDYFKRVALRLANTARDRREAEGGQGGLGLSNDELEDERKIQSVGKMDLGDGVMES